MEYLKFSDRSLRHLASMPFIYIMIFPLILLDIFVELYHRVCFPLYDIELVPRKAFIRMDRHKLEYLNLWQKINCIYCGYANGLARYTTVIGAETEKYWCGIQHKKSSDFVIPKHQKNFAKYNNKKDFEDKYKK